MVSVGGNTTSIGDGVPGLAKTAQRRWETNKIENVNERAKRVFKVGGNVVAGKVDVPLRFFLSHVFHT